MKHVQSNRCEEERYVQVYTASYSHDLNQNFVQNNPVFFKSSKELIKREPVC